jgi:hypothetical protein
MPQVFGSATVWAQSQTSEGTVSGANPAQPAFLAGSACLVNASFVDTTDAPLIPSALQYRIDDVVSGAEILGWTTVTPAAAVQVTVSATQNAMVSNSACSETHQVAFAITDPSGNGPFYARCLFDLLRIPEPT